MRFLSGFTGIVALFLVQALTASGQAPVFGVYFNAGNIKCTSARGKGTHPLSYHEWLSEGDRVSLQDNISELILFDHDSSYLRLDGKGSYSVLELEKLPRHRLTDTTTIRYFSLLWDDAPRPSSRTAAHPQPNAPSKPTPSRTPASSSRPAASLFASAALVLQPRIGYSTSLDSCIFRWRHVSWARKYFLRIRTGQGEIRFDSVLADTQAIVHFATRMPPDTYYWALDIVGESGRLQFGDSSHLVLIDEAPVIAAMPPLPEDSLGGITAVLRKIAQYEAYGCTRSAAGMYVQLTTDFPADSALEKMYLAFLLRNGLL